MKTKIEHELRRYYGLPPYTTLGVTVAGDEQYANKLKDKYSKEEIAETIATLKQEAPWVNGDRFK